MFGHNFFANQFVQEIFISFDRASKELSNDTKIAHKALHPGELKPKNHSQRPIRFWASAIVNRWLSDCHFDFRRERSKVRIQVAEIFF